MPRKKSAQKSTQIRRNLRDQALARLAAQIASDAEACHLFGQTESQHGQEHFIGYMVKNNLGTSQSGEAFSGQTYRQFRIYAGYHSKDNRLSHLPNLVGALAVLQSRKASRRSAKRNLVRQLFLGTPVFIGSHLYSKVAALEQPYPPVGEWVCESQSIHNAWHAHMQYGQLPDPRMPRRSAMHILDPARLQKDVAAGETQFFRDSKTGEIIGGVIRDFIPAASIVYSLNKAVVGAAEVKRNVRVCTLSLPILCSLDLMCSNIEGGSWKTLPSRLLGRISESPLLQLGPELHKEVFSGAGTGHQLQG